MAKLNVLALAGFIILCLLAGAIGSLFTFQSVQAWYPLLQKPAFTPPNWVFGPVWTALYLLMGSAAYLVYEQGPEKEKVREALNVFGIQLALNCAWSIMFFGFRSPLAGLFTIILLWLSIAWAMVLFRKLSRNASLLLVPYLAWVSFASALNASILLMNP